MRHTFSLETEREKDLGVLAETIVSCTLKKKHGGCKNADCSKCQTWQEFSQCMSVLPACDSLYVKQLAQELYGEREFQYGLDRPPLKCRIREVLDAVKTGALTLAGSLLLAFAMYGFVVWFILSVD